MEASNASQTGGWCSRNRKILVIGAVIVVIIIIAVTIGVVLSKKDEEEDLVVSTEAGEIRGRREGEAAVFKGIPYAKPPTGKRRWRPPVLCGKGECWKGVLDAAEFSSPCTQPDILNLSYVFGQEDCLFINVWSPDLDPIENLPVVLFIHGGYLNFWSPQFSGLHFNGDMVTDMKIVAVNFNYRLNAFGFMALDALAESSPSKTSGNYGFMDQILALKWVKNNIAKFGGDPNRVTLMGQSSGGTSQLALLTAPSAKGLFRGAILMSASSVYNMSSADAAKDNKATFLKNANCDKISINDTLDCLYDLSPKEVVNAVAWTSYPNWAMSDLTDFPTAGKFDGAVAVVDGDIVPKPPLLAMATGVGNDVPIIIGTTAQEIEMYPVENFKNQTRKQFDDFAEARLTPIIGQAKAQEALSMCKGSAQYCYLTMASDMRMNCPNDVIALNASKGFNSPVYRYVVTNQPSKPFHFLGVTSTYSLHIWDLVAFFGFPSEMKYTPSDRDLDFMRNVRMEIGTFIREGKVGTKDWGPYPNNTALFANNGTLVLGSEGYHGKECKLWMENGLFSYAWIN